MKKVVAAVKKKKKSHVWKWLLADVSCQQHVSQYSGQSFERNSHMTWGKVDFYAQCGIYSVNVSMIV